MNKIIERQKRLNTQLARLFQLHHIKKFRVTSLGNSIASGYSMTRTIKPLLIRNESLESIMSSFDIALDRHQFARPQNNCDEHIFEWLVSNVKETDIYKMNHVDYFSVKNCMPTVNGITSDNIHQYYPLDIEGAPRIQEVILESTLDMANVVIYNGATGSFLDNVTRRGKIHHKLTYGIKRDISSIDATLQFIQSYNRLDNSNTQVYLCGAPNYLGLGVTEAINAKLKKLAKKYANVVYVPPIKSRFLYHPLHLVKNKFFKHILLPDTHYSEDEYLKLNNGIISSISVNYLTTQAMISLDRELYRLSSMIELEYPEYLDIPQYIEQQIMEMLERISVNLANEEERKKFYNQAKRYLINRTPYDFYYVGKKNIKAAIKGMKKDS